MLINPALASALALYAGSRCAPRVGLGAPFFASVAAGAPDWRLLARQAWIGLAAGAAIAPLVATFIQWSGQIAAQNGGPELASLPFPLATRVLYGGVVEEILMRWGLMSFLVWAIARPRLPSPPNDGAFWLALSLAAALFSLGHLPADWPLPTHLIAFALFANLGAGAIFGWLFWRLGLEAAILAHASTHLIAVALVFAFA